MWLPFVIYGQSNTETILDNIAKNNKTILANKQYWKAQNTLFETGLTPYDPKVEFDYLFGSPSEMGDQTDFTIVQPLDFPTVYGKKRKLADAQKQQSEFAHKIVEQDILLEAKKVCIELIYRNRLQTKLNQRKENTEQWMHFFQKKLDTGDGNILDLNKAKLHLIDINTEWRKNQSEIQTFNQKLVQLNGGNPVELNATVYDVLELIPDIETLKAEIKEVNPHHEFLEQQKLIAEKQTEVAKALNLPKFEIGYHYQSILNQRFNGIHVGINIPLWENKNKVEAQRQFELLANEELNKVHLQHLSELEQLYSQYQNKESLLEEYKTVLESVNSTSLLDKALKYGEISVLQYFQESSYYYESTKNLLQMEKEYQEIVAELMKHKLITE